MHNVPIEDFFDLHSFRPEETGIAVEEYLFQAVMKGYRQVRIIHGRGIGVQREIVHSLLRTHPHVVSFSDAPDRGSTIVLLRSPR
jgi:dsDNA-specific endonuclease/ATPase MutS2